MILFEKQNVCNAKPIAIAIARLIVCPVVESVIFYGKSSVYLDELDVTSVGNPNVFFRRECLIRDSSALLVSCVLKGLGVLEGLGAGVVLCAD